MARSLSQLSPFGPIFGKELRTTARRKRTYWLRVIYLGVLFLFLLAGYSSTSARGYQGVSSVAERSRQEAELGLLFFRIFAMFSVTMMPLIAPVLTATAISAERLGKTLNVLLMTPITSWQIVSGKLFSRLLIAITLLALSLPVLAVVRLLGGVDLDAMIAVLCLCASVALLGAALGLFFSTILKRGYAVILLSYLSFFVLYGIIPFILVSSVAANRSSRPSTAFIDFISVTNPFISTVMLAGARGFFKALPWWWCALFHVGMAAALVMWTGRILRRRVLREGEPAARSEPERLPLPESSAAIHEAEHASRFRQRQVREVSDNPVLWRELRRPLMAKRSQALIGSIACVALLLLSYALLANQYTNELKSVESQAGYAVILYSLILLLVCVLSGTAISGEKETDTWTLLLATPLRGGAIVRGKVAGILRRTMWPTALFAAHLGIFALCGVLSWTAVFVTLWVALTFTSIFLALGLWFSLRLRSNTAAVIASLLMPVCLYLILSIILIILGNLIYTSRPGQLAENMVYYFPYFYMVVAITALPGSEHWSWDTTTSRIDFPGDHSGAGSTPSNFVLIAMIAGMIHLLIAGLILSRLAVKFDRIVSRASQRDHLPPPSEMAAGLLP